MNTRLKQYSHVNKKAAEQFNQFYQQREALAKRKNELDQSESHIQDLIKSLDQRKTEAMDRTFKHVSAHFTSVFRELVPQGHGTLHMLQNVGSEEAEDKENSSLAKNRKNKKHQKDSLETYKGVSIKVNALSDISFCLTH